MKQVTLTFDNGPTEKTTPMVLAELQKRNLLAYFCIVGTQLQSELKIDLARQTLDAGHKLVNHSLTHEVPLGDDPSAEHALREIGEMHQLMDDKFEDWGERWFRPFGGGGAIGQHIFSPQALLEFERLNYSVLLWNSVPRDWEDPEGWVDTAIGDLETHKHTVVVLHDIDTGAMEKLPQFLDEIQSREIEITQALPPECIPIRRGNPCFAAAQMSALVSAA